MKFIHMSTEKVPPIRKKFEVFRSGLHKIVEREKNPLEIYLRALAVSFARKCGFIFTSQLKDQHSIRPLFSGKERLGLTYLSPGARPLNFFE
nr:MAG: hypothetical protein CGL2_10933015 [Leptospirillum sp. Group II '5-way CG']